MTQVLAQLDPYRLAGIVSNIRNEIIASLESVQSEMIHGVPSDYNEYKRCVGRCGVLMELYEEIEDHIRKAFSSESEEMVHH